MSPFGGQVVAQLGQTTDPRALIPGSPEAVHEAVTALTDRGGRFEGVGTDLGQVQIPDWSGQASSTFWETFSGERPNWFKASDAMSAAAGAVSAHADALSAAQAKAAEAIDLWEQGKAATERAVAEYNSAVQQAGDLVGDIPPFSDPGEALREQAREVLERARRQLAEAGQAAAEVIRGVGGHAADAPAWLAKAGEVADAAIREYGLGSTEIKNAFSDTGFPVSDEQMRNWGDETEDGHDSDFGWKVALAQVGGEANVWSGEVSGSTDLGPLGLSGNAGLDVLGVEGNAELSIGSNGLQGQAGVQAYLAKASAEGAATLGPAELGAHAEGYVGGEAKGELSIGPSGLHAGGEVFAGAKGEVGAHADVGGIGAGVNAEGWVGAGAAADVNVGMNDGKFTIGGELGAGLGIGGKISGEITVDPGKVVDTAGDAADAVRDGVGSAVDAGKDAWDNTLGRL